jgi:hypothetical protein
LLQVWLRHGRCQRWPREWRGAGAGEANLSSRRHLIRLVRGGAEGAFPESAAPGPVEAIERQRTYVKVTPAGVSGEALILAGPDRAFAQCPAEVGEPIIATGESPSGCSPPIGELRAAPPGPRPKH